MSKLSFTVERTTICGGHDVTYLRPDAPLTTELAEAAVQNIGTELWVTVGDVTMFLAAWEDPTHWAEEWATKLGVDSDDAPEAVLELLAQAVEET